MEKKDLLDIMNEETNYLFKTEQYEKAISSLIDYKEKSLELGDYQLYSTALSKLIICYEVLGESEDELLIIKEMLNFLNNLVIAPKNLKTASMYLNCVSGLCNVKDYDRALDSLNRAYDIVSDMDDTSIDFYAQYYNELGKYYKSRENYQKAIDIYKEAISQFISMPGDNSLYVAKGHINIVLTLIYFAVPPIREIKFNLLEAYNILLLKVPVDLVNIGYFKEVIRELKYFEFKEEATKLEKKVSELDEFSK